jgi:hypothetical protein
LRSLPATFIHSVIRRAGASLSALTARKPVLRSALQCTLERLDRHGAQDGRYRRRARATMTKLSESAAEALRPFRGKRSTRAFDADVAFAVRLVFATLDQQLFLPLAGADAQLAQRFGAGVDGQGSVRHEPARAYQKYMRAVPRTCSS